MSADRNHWIPVLSVLLALGIAAPLVAAPRGSLKVESITLGARVKVDGREVGVVPLKKVIPLRAGRHRLLLEKPGYRRVKMVVVIRPGRREVRKVVLKAVAGVLALRSTPEGASVLIDGQTIGQAPIKGVEMAPGSRSIEARISGYHPWTRKLEVTAGKTYQFRALLEPDPDAPASPAPELTMLEDPFAIVELDAPERIEPAATGSEVAMEEIDPFALVDLEASVPGSSGTEAAPSEPEVVARVAPHASVDATGDPGTREPGIRPVWRRWWVWTAVGVVVTTGVTAALAAGAPPRRVLDCSPVSGVDGHLGLAGCGP